MSVPLVTMPVMGDMNRPELVYIAGPMTGYAKFNFPLFDKLAAELRDLGMAVITPSELDDPKAREAALQSEWGDPEEYAKLTGLTWADFLSRDVKVIADGGFTSIVCLPGWEKSRGARLETFVGHLCGIGILEYQGDESGTIWPVPKSHLYAAWAGLTADSFMTLMANS